MYYLLIDKSNHRVTFCAVEPPIAHDGQEAVAATAEQIAAAKAGKMLVWDPATESIAIQDRKPRVPGTIRAWQAKAILKATSHPEAGTMFAAAEAAIAAMPDGLEKIAIQSAWDHNAEFSRDAPTIANLAAALGLSRNALDSMFAQASKLTV